MLRLTYDKGSGDVPRRSITPRELHPNIVYQLQETFAGQSDRKQPPRRVTGASINAMIKTGEIHALRDYRVQDTTA